MRRQNPQLTILDPYGPMGRLELEITMRLSREYIRIGSARLRLLVVYQPASPSLN